MGQLHQLSKELLWSRAERQVNPFPRPEQIGHTREVCPGNTSKQQSRSTACDDSPVDLGNLEVGVDRRFYGSKISFALQEIQEFP